MNDLWVEKYRPDTFDGYVFKDSTMEAQIRDWIENPDKKRIPIPHVLFSGNPGTGKTTLARILINLLGVEPGDVLDINASRENGVETIRNKIVSFCSTWAVGDYKIVMLDEVDRMSFEAQAILRGEIERFSEGVRFILTCNYPQKLIPALHSRMQSYHIDKLDLETFMERMLNILITENVDFNPYDIEAYVHFAYPDLRKCINLLDQNTTRGKLSPMKAEEEASLDYIETFAELFMAKQYMEARQYICGIIQPDDFETVFKYFYRNLHLFGSDEASHKAAIIIIAEGLKNHVLTSDSEINLASTIVQLSNI